jgi:ribosomal 50S subunit-recycling heat shock protein
MTAMRLDLFLSKTGVVKRRTMAKELADNGLIRVNGNVAKAGKEIEAGDIVRIAGNRALAIEVLAVPSGSVKKTDREKYFKILELK